MVQAHLGELTLSVVGFASHDQANKPRGVPAEGGEMLSEGHEGP